jgi:hypothetical protein
VSKTDETCFSPLPLHMRYLLAVIVGATRDGNIAWHLRGRADPVSLDLIPLTPTSSRPET